MLFRSGGIAGALMNGKSEGVEIIGNTAINAQIAENTVTNNYLSGWQAKQEMRSLRHIMVAFAVN